MVTQILWLLLSEIAWLRNCNINNTKYPCTLVNCMKPSVLLSQNASVEKNGSVLNSMQNKSSVSCKNLLYLNAFFWFSTVREGKRSLGNDFLYPFFALRTCWVDKVDVVCIINFEIILNIHFLSLHLRGKKLLFVKIKSIQTSIKRQLINLCLSSLLNALGQFLCWPDYFYFEYWPQKIVTK